MADVNYYLRDTTAQKETGVMLFFSYNGKRLKIATLEKINPKYWNSKNQRAKQTTSFPTHSHFNTRLEMNNTICLNAYRKFLNDNNQEQPSPQQIKDLLKANLNPSEAIETKAQFDLIGFTELFIKESETGKRLTDKGTPVQIGTIKIYRTLKKTL